MAAPIVVLFLVLLAVGLAVGAVLWRVGTWGRLALVGLTIAAVWAAAASLSPEPAYFAEVFEQAAGVAWPASGEVLDSGIAYPEATDDACDAAVVRISQEDAERLRGALRQRPTAASAPRTCGDIDVASGGPYLATLDAYEASYSIWWGVSEDGHTLALVHVRP